MWSGPPLRPTAQALRSGPPLRPSAQSLRSGPPLRPSAQAPRLGRYSTLTKSVYPPLPFLPFFHLVCFFLSWNKRRNEDKTKPETSLEFCDFAAAVQYCMYIAPPLSLSTVSYCRVGGGWGGGGREAARSAATPPPHSWAAGSVLGRGGAPTPSCRQKAGLAAPGQAEKSVNWGSRISLHSVLHITGWMGGKVYTVRYVFSLSLTQK